MKSVIRNAYAFYKVIDFDNLVVLQSIQSKNYALFVRNHDKEVSFQDFLNNGLKFEEDK